jgi:hypothetical protein
VTKGNLSVAKPRKRKPDIERWPALELPFVKLRDHPRPKPPNGKPLDYWAPPTIRGESFFKASFRGGHYARLTVEYMARQEQQQESVLVNIIGCMIEKGRFWAEFSDDKMIRRGDVVATGFVSTMASILCWAHAAGLLRQQALSQAAYLEQQLDFATFARSKIAKKEIAKLRAFAADTGACSGASCAG